MRILNFIAICVAYAIIGYVYLPAALVLLVIDLGLLSYFHRKQPRTSNGETD